MKSASAPPPPPASRPTRSSTAKLPPTSRPSPSHAAVQSAVVAPPIPPGFAGKSLSLPLGRPASAVVRPPTTNAILAANADADASETREAAQPMNVPTHHPSSVAGVPPAAAFDTYVEATYDDEDQLADADAGLPHHAHHVDPSPPDHVHAPSASLHVVHRLDGGDAMEQMDGANEATPPMQTSPVNATPALPPPPQDDEEVDMVDDDYLVHAPDPEQPTTNHAETVPSMQPTALPSTALVVDDSDDDDAFFPSNPVVTPPAGFRQAPPSAFAAQPNQTMDTPQPLRQLFAAEEPSSPPPDVREALSVDGSTDHPGDHDVQPHHDENASDAKPEQGQRLAKRDALEPVVQPEMDFSTEPIEHWRQLEEAQRERERAARRRRQSAASIEDTIKRLSKPKTSSVAAKPELPAEHDAPTPHRNPAAQVHADGHSTSPGGIAMPQGLGWGALNAPTSDRPNETHYYLMVHVLGSKHRLALPKKATMAAVAEALDLANGALSRQDGSLVPWSSTMGQLGLQPGMAGRTHFKFVSRVEQEEAIERSALVAECIGWIAHRLAFSEWVLRCSDRISRHVFFDATDAFEDVVACTS